MFGWHLQQCPLGYGVATSLHQTSVMGEPWKFLLADGELDPWLSKLKFEPLFELHPREMEQLYARRNSGEVEPMLGSSCFVLARTK